MRHARADAHTRALSVAPATGLGTGSVIKWAEGSGWSWLGELGTGLDVWNFVTAGIDWLAPDPVGDRGSSWSP